MFEDILLSLLIIVSGLTFGFVVGSLLVIIIELFEKKDYWDE